MATKTVYASGAVPDLLSSNAIDAIDMEGRMPEINYKGLAQSSGGLRAQDLPTLVEGSEEGRSSISTEAQRIRDERSEQYGPPAPHFKMVAKLWNEYLKYRRPYTYAADFNIKPWEVVTMMAILKMVRLWHDPAHEDSATDMAVYLEFAREFTNDPVS